MAKKKDEKWKKTSKLSFDANALSKRLKKAEDKSTTHAHKFIVRRWTSMGDVRRHVISWFLLIGFLILMIGIQLFWYRNSYTTEVSAKNGVYVEGVMGPIQTLNPLYVNSNGEQALSKLIFSQPMQYDTSGNLGYDLLSGLKIDETETVYTLTLRKDAKWHDDAPVTVDDLIFTINLLKNPTVKANTYNVWNNVEAKKIDEQTIEIKLNSPFAPFQHYLTFAVLPEHILKDVDPTALRENQFSTNPVGSGPFIFRLLQDGDGLGASSQAVHLVRNDNYYKGKALLSRFQMLAYEKQDSLLNALKFNEVNGLADLTPKQLSEVDNKRYNVRSSATQGGVYLLFNTASEKLNTAKMRQAIRSGINTTELRENIGGKYLQELFTPIIAETAQAIKPVFNVNTAKMYLDELGWKQTNNGTWKKGDEELRLKIAVIKSPELELAADEVVKQLNNLGIKTDTQILDLEDVDQGALQNILQPRDFDILINKINIGADSDVYAYWHSSQANKNGLNFSNYKNAIADDALASARNKRSPELRAAKYKTFINRWLEDVPGIGLYQTTANYVNLKSVRSFGDDVKLVSPVSRYSDVLYWSAGKQSVYKTP